jgi:hypothetical protein
MIQLIFKMLSYAISYATYKNPSKLNTNSAILLNLPPIQFPSTIPQPRRRLLRRNIPLRLRHQLIPHQKLPHRRAPQQRGIEMHMQITTLNFLLTSLQGRLMDTGTVWERAFEEIIIPPRNLRDSLCKLQFFFFVEIG